MIQRPDRSETCLAAPRRGCLKQGVRGAWRPQGERWPPRAPPLEHPGCEGPVEMYWAQEGDLPAQGRGLILQPLMVGWERGVLSIFVCLPLSV